jgi:hypothetical protein
VANFEDTGLPHSAGVPYFPPSQGGSPGPIDAGPGVACGHATVPFTGKFKFQVASPPCLPPGRASGPAWQLDSEPNVDPESRCWSRLGVLGALARAVCDYSRSAIKGQI